MKKLLLPFLALALFMVPNFAKAADVATDLVGAQGYDLVSYQSEEGPVKGNGYHVTDHNGVTYQFSSKKNKKAFEANPAQYLPEYGGYCAFGVSVGKKFTGDPEVWKVVDGKLYFNLDTDIQKKWSKDIPGNIVKADKNWTDIKGKKASEL